MSLSGSSFADAALTVSGVSFAIMVVCIVLFVRRKSAANRKPLSLEDSGKWPVQKMALFAPMSSAQLRIYEHLRSGLQGGMLLVPNLSLGSVAKLWANRASAKNQQLLDEVVLDFVVLKPNGEAVAAFHLAGNKFRPDDAKVAARALKAAGIRYVKLQPESLPTPTFFASELMSSSF